MKKHLIISEETFEKARRKIRKSRERPIIFTSNNDELNRKVLEKEKISILLLNQKNRKDFSKQRNSGLNHVLTKIAKKNNIKIGINLDGIIDSEKKQKARIISRIKQNIRLCNKEKIQMVFVSSKFKRGRLELRALGSTLGMPTWMTKNF